MLSINIMRTIDLDADTSIRYPDSWFQSRLPKKYLMTEFSKQAIKEIDKSEVVSEHNILSPVLGSIPNQYLSTGVKNVILMMYDKENRVCSLDYCGNNCIPAIIRVASEKDIKTSATVFKPFFDFEGIDKIHIANDDTIVTNNADLLGKFDIFMP